MVLSHKNKNNHRFNLKLKFLEISLYFWIIEITKIYKEDSLQSLQMCEKYKEKMVTEWKKV